MKVRILCIPYVREKLQLPHQWKSHYAPRDFDNDEMVLENLECMTKFPQIMVKVSDKAIHEAPFSLFEKVIYRECGESKEINAMIKDFSNNHIEEVKKYFPDKVIEIGWRFVLLGINGK